MEAASRQGAAELETRLLWEEGTGHSPGLDSCSVLAPTVVTFGK